MNEEKWKKEYKIRQKQNEIAEEIKNELLKKAETEYQRNVIKETINSIKKKHRFDYLKKWNRNFKTKNRKDGMTYEFSTENWEK